MKKIYYLLEIQVFGKTYLSNCIAKEILDNNKTVLYQTAPYMLDNIISYRFGNNDLKNYYKNLIENERDKLVLLEGRTINLFEDIFNEKHTNNTNTERTGNTEADSEKRWEQSMRSYKKYKLESNIKKEYEKLKRRMKYPVHYVRHIIANIGPFGMIICTTGLWSLSEKGLTDHSWIVLAFIIGEVIGMIITIYNIGYVGEY